MSNYYHIVSLFHCYTRAYTRMNADDIKAMFEGIDENTKNIIARKLNRELASAIVAVNKDLADNNVAKTNLCPRVDQIFHACRLCPLARIRIVLLGQDPYIKEDEAMGLSFAVQRTRKLPPSLKNINQCLQYCGILKTAPTHGDLSNVAKQGVLFLNTSLSTRLGVSNAHAKAWSAYTDALLKELSALPQQIIFIMLGGPAKAKANLIDKRRHVVLEWGHPSPLNAANQTDNPLHFKYCTAFKRANDILTLKGELPINWDPDAAEPARVEHIAAAVPQAPIQRADAPLQLVNMMKNPESHDIKIAPEIRDVSGNDPFPLTTDTLYIFTDGGSTGNGFAHCRASYGYYITDGCRAITMGGMVDPVDIPGKVYKSSNQRGELSAILFALLFTLTHADEFDFTKIMVVSDSEYGIKCLNEWIVNWVSNPVKYKLSEKMNLDLIMPAKEALDALRSRTDVTFKHMNSHMDEPTECDTEEWFMWKCNDIVDKVCTKILK